MANYDVYGNLIDDPNKFDFGKVLGSDAFKNGLAAFGLGKDLLGGYFTWKNSQDMKDIMNREIGLKEEMWGRQEEQLDKFNKAQDDLNAGYKSTSPQTVPASPVFNNEAKTMAARQATGLAASDVPQTLPDSVVRKPMTNELPTFRY